MSTAALSHNERLALQAGALVKVVVANTKAGNDSIWVNLERNSASEAPAPPASKGSPAAVARRPVPTKVVKPQVKPARLINELKTGMALDGVISSSTHYAAFIDVQTHRASRGRGCLLGHAT